MVSTRRSSTRLTPPLPLISPRRRVSTSTARVLRQQTVARPAMVQEPPVDQPAGAADPPAAVPAQQPPNQHVGQQAPIQQQIPPQQQPQVFTFGVDPFENDINPATSEGQKLFLKATAERSTKLTVSQKHVTKFMSAMEADSNSFAWGELVNLIPTSATTTHSLLTDYDDISLDHVKSQAYKVWGNHLASIDDPLPNTFLVQNIDPVNNMDHRKIFYLRVRSKMIAKRLQHSIDAASWETLIQHQHEFAWRNAKGNLDYDGPTMLKLMLSVINPSTRVGVKELRRKLRTTRLSQFRHNVQDMLENMNGNYVKILAKKQKHDNFDDDLFEALLSTKNQVFHNYIQRLQDEWETGTDYTPGQIMELALQKYANMSERGVWHQNEKPDSQLHALATRLDSMENQIQGSSSSSKPKSTKSSSFSTKKKFGIEEWRMSKQGNTKIVNGVTYWWCPHHRNEGQFDGLYVTHKPSEHDSWKAERDRKNAAWKDKRRSKTDKSSTSSGKTPASKRLVMSEKLKSVLVSKLSCSDADADEIWQEFSQDF